MTPEPFLDAAHELDVSQRRILQLEAALMRRTELLEQKQAELANIKASRAYQFVHNIQKLFNRVFPIHSRRRAFVRSGPGQARAADLGLHPRCGGFFRQREHQLRRVVGSGPRRRARGEREPAGMGQRADPLTTPG